MLTNPKSRQYAISRNNRSKSVTFFVSCCFFKKQKRNAEVNHTITITGINCSEGSVVNAVVEFILLSLETKLCYSEKTVKTSEN